MSIISNKVHMYIWLALKIHLFNEITVLQKVVFSWIRTHARWAPAIGNTCNINARFSRAKKPEIVSLRGMLRKELSLNVIFHPFLFFIFLFLLPFLFFLLPFFALTDYVPSLCTWSHSLDQWFSNFLHQVTPQKKYLAFQVPPLWPNLKSSINGCPLLVCVRVCVCVVCGRCVVGVCVCVVCVWCVCVCVCGVCVCVCVCVVGVCERVCDFE